MARDRKYGQVTIERGSIPKGEPVFLVRAGDVLAIDTLKHYVEQAGRFGCDAGFVEDVKRAIVDFSLWDGDRRLPD